MKTSAAILLALGAVDARSVWQTWTMPSDKSGDYDLKWQWYTAYDDDNDMNLYGTW